MRNWAHAHARAIKKKPKKNQMHFFSQRTPFGDRSGSRSSLQPRPRHCPLRSLSTCHATQERQQCNSNRAYSIIPSSLFLKVKRTLFPKRLHVPVKRKRRAQHSMPAHTHCKYQTRSLAPQRSLAFGLRRAGSSPVASFLALEGTSGCAVSLGNPSVLFLPCLFPLERPSLTSNRAASSHDHMRENFKVSNLVLRVPFQRTP